VPICANPPVPEIMPPKVGVERLTANRPLSLTLPGSSRSYRRCQHREPPSMVVPPL
jgi:hypothetical protein